MSFPNSHPQYTCPGFPRNHQDPKRPRYSETSYEQYMPMNSRMNPSPNPAAFKGTTNIFFKTRMCAKFLEGSCNNGANCTFAHGTNDLRQPPPNWQDLVRDGGPKNGNGDQRMTQQMKICRKFYNGEECQYGQRCNFLHERPNQNSVSSSDARSNAINSYQSHPANQNNVSSSDELSRSNANNSYQNHPNQNIVSSRDEWSRSNANPYQSHPNQNNVSSTEEWSRSNANPYQSHPNQNSVSSNNEWSRSNAINPYQSHPTNQKNVSSSDEWSRSNAINPYLREGTIHFQRNNNVICINTENKVVNPNLDALVNPNSATYLKTKLCNKWKISGQCPFGERCKYAHGYSELNVPEDLSNIQIKPSTVPVTDPSPTIDIGAQKKIAGEEKKIPKWMLKRKINKIYGDWIDDLAPKEVEDW